MTQLLTHVDSTVVANHGGKCCDQTDHRGSAIAIPTATVGELRENGLGVTDGCQHPQWDDHNEETRNVQNQNEGFDKRELLGEESVEENGKEGDGNGDEGAVPLLKDIIRVVQDGQALDDGTCQESNRHNGAFPARGAQPA